MKGQDVMDEVVARLVEMMEAGAETWTMPWAKIATGGYPVNAITGHEYRGGNVLALAYYGAHKGYRTARWATYKQWQSIGATVRKGEKGTHIVFWSPVDRVKVVGAAAETGDEQTRTFHGFYKGFVVFNLDQVDNGPEVETPEPRPELERIETAETFFQAIGADIRYGGNAAFYNGTADYVQVPAFDQFTTSLHAYGTLAHELTHWTGHKSRLDRTFGKRFGDHEYAAEELVAELGAAFTCARIGIDTVARTDHAAYLKHWVTMLKQTPSLLWSVASKAQAASDYLVEQSTKKVEVTA